MRCGGCSARSSRSISASSTRRAAGPSRAARRRNGISGTSGLSSSPAGTAGIHLWGEPIEVPADADETTLARYRQAVEDALNTLGREADRRMGHHDKNLPLPFAGPSTDAQEGRGEGDASHSPAANRTDTALTLPSPASGRGFKDAERKSAEGGGR